MGDLQDDEWPRFAEAIGHWPNCDLHRRHALALLPATAGKVPPLHSEHAWTWSSSITCSCMTSGTQVENRVQEDSYISRSLKALAR
jgi:replicative DNA helicase